MVKRFDDATMAEIPAATGIAVVLITTKGRAQYDYASWESVPASLISGKVTDGSQVISVSFVDIAVAGSSPGKPGMPVNPPITSTVNPPTVPAALPIGRLPQ